VETLKNKLPLVIVRAWGDEPVVLHLHRIENNRCYVGSEDTDKPIGLRHKDVFAFDSTMFSTLSTAYTQGDMEVLRQIWAGISVDDFACNRYQDNVVFSHDQEHFTDSAGDASGHHE
jgi:hypothetical protein